MLTSTRAGGDSRPKPIAIVVTVGARAAQDGALAFRVAPGRLQSASRPSGGAGAVGSGVMARPACAMRALANRRQRRRRFQRHFGGEHRRRAFATGPPPLRPQCSRLDRFSRTRLMGGCACARSTVLPQMYTSTVSGFGRAMESIIRLAPQCSARLCIRNRSSR